MPFFVKRIVVIYDFVPNEPENRITTEKNGTVLVLFYKIVPDAAAIMKV